MLFQAIVDLNSDLRTKQIHAWYRSLDMVIFPFFTRPNDQSMTIDNHIMLFQLSIEKACVT